MTAICFNTCSSIGRGPACGYHGELKHNVTILGCGMWLHIL